METSEPAQLDTIPHDLALRVLTTLRPHDLAAAAQVCRSWRVMVDQDDVWQASFMRHFGDQASKDSPELASGQSWKGAFAIHKRREEFGTETKIVREGEFYNVVKDGHVVRSLGKRKRVACEPPAICAAKRNSFSSTLSERCSCPSSESALDMILFFLGDLERATRAASPAPLDVSLIKSL